MEQEKVGLTPMDLLIVCACVGVIVITVTLATWYWGYAHPDEVQRAQASIELHQGMSHTIIAFLVSLAGVTIANVFLTFALDALNTRRQVMKDVKENRATALDKALFTVGTAVFNGLLFFAIMDSMSAG